MDESPIDGELVQIAEREQSAEQALAKLHQEYPQVFEQMKQIEAAFADVERLKTAVKEKLVKDQDFDLHRIGKLRVSVSKTAKVKVKDIDAVPEDFKSTEVVVNEKKAREYLKVMGELPAGFEDVSFYRLNWKMGA